MVFTTTYLAWNGKVILPSQIVVPTHGLLFRTDINDGLVVDAVFPDDLALAAS
jgi:hypothetical protein